MLTIIAKYASGLQLPPKGIVSRPSMGFSSKLELGEYWEEVTARYFNAQGLEAVRPDQDFKYKSEFTRLQRDLDVWTPSGRPLVVEVKSRRGPFQWPTVDVGLVNTWDAKEFEVAALVVIDQETYEAAVTSVGDRSQWLKRHNHDYCYSVPRAQFGPLEGFVDAVKDGLYDG